MNSPRAHTCPPGPELLENDNSTNSFGIFLAAPPNCVTHPKAFTLSSSVKSSESEGGLGSSGMPTALWTPKRWFPVKVFRHKGDLFGLKGDLSTIERRWTSIEKKKIQRLDIECQVIGKKSCLQLAFKPNWEWKFDEGLFSLCLLVSSQLLQSTFFHLLCLGILRCSQSVRVLSFLAWSIVNPVHPYISGNHWYAIAIALII